MQANVAFDAAGPGGELRRAREDRGLTVEQASQATCIPARYLRALEEDAPTEVFPAPVYERFFLREYARLLGLDDRPMVAAFDERHAAELEPELSALPEFRPERRVRGRLLGALSGLILAGLAVLSLTARGSEPAAPPSPSVAIPSAVPAPEGSDVPRRTEAPPRVKEIRALLVAREACWVRATADGEVVFEGTVQPGERVRLRADRRLLLRLGNAQGVSLRVNGERVPTRGTVLDLAFAVRQGELISR